MRSVLLLIALVVTGCVDAPLEPAHLTPDGQLRGVQLEQSAFAAPERRPSTPVARVTAVLAAEDAGAVRDSVVFTPDVTAVHLHLRVDGLTENRPVTFVWSHGEDRIELPGVLAPTGALTLASSCPIAPAQTGWWRVEVIESGSGDAAAGETAQQVLFMREFQVL